LLQSWFDLVRDERRAQGVSAQAGLAAQQLEVVRLRVAAGDAPRLDWLQAQLEHERLVAEQASAVLRAGLARADWQRRYPVLAGAAVELPKAAPPTPVGDAGWPSQSTASPELVRARHEAALAELRARRLSLDRHADPTLGVRVSRERGGEERVLGLSISWAFGGPQRDARANAAGAEAAAAAARLQESERQISGDVEAERRQAVGLAGTHALLAQVAERAEETAALSRRAYAAGEQPLVAVLQVQRQAREARTAAELALIDVLQANARLMLRSQALLSAPPLTEPAR
jgi:outer membrane protein TolC